MESMSRPESDPLIKVIGVGGGVCYAINLMVENGPKGVEFIAVHTDQQVLYKSKAPKRVFLGEIEKRGLDGGGDPHKAQKAAEDSTDELYKIVCDADLTFIVSAMGGGTGTGAAPVVARIAKKAGALTIGLVTRPFMFEGTRRMQKAMDGINILKNHVDTLIVYSNDRLLETDKHASVVEAFKIIDNLLLQGIKDISELITVPGLICLDLDDVRTIMSGAKFATLIFGKASGEDRARIATEKAISSCPIDFPMGGALSILVNITSGQDLALIEVSQAIELIRKPSRPDVNLLFGAIIDTDLCDEFRVTVIANGYESMGCQELFPRFHDLDI
jgi:cell division protein FtsZ